MEILMTKTERAGDRPLFTLDIEKRKNKNEKSIV